MDENWDLQSSPFSNFIENNICAIVMYWLLLVTLKIQIKGGDLTEIIKRYPDERHKMKHPKT